MESRYWRAAEPKPAYDVVIVGGGGHGLATAYYLAKNHGITDVCVVEKGWLGGGNVARNTTIIRSNYLWDESAAIYEHSLKLWEGLEDDLDFDLQFCQRGVLNLAHDLGEVRSSMRRVDANRLNGVDAEWLDARGGEGVLPDREHLARRPVPGARRDAAAPRRRRAARQGRVGVRDARERARRRHRRARRGHGVPPRARRSRRGRRDDARHDPRAEGRARGRGTHERARRRWSGSGCRCSRIRCRRWSRALYEPVLDCVVMSNAVHVYVSQADKGELVMGAGIDAYNGYAQRGSFHVIEHQLAAAVELFPIFAHATLLRTWAGIVDVCPDASPIVGLDADRRALPELRLGHRRVQGDAGQRLGLRRHDRERASPPSSRSPTRSTGSRPAR